MNTARPTAPLPSALRDRLARFVKTHGEGAALALLHLPRQTLARAVAGFNVRAGTAALIERCLESKERTAA